MRLFIAVLFDDVLRAALCGVQDAFRRAGVRGNYTRPENLHLTLAFIGEYPDAQAVLDVVDAVPFEPARLRLSGVGAFGDLWWVGLDADPALAAYVRRLRHALSDAGIPFDRKRFSPHITLVRRAVPGPNGMPGVRVPGAAMTAAGATLMRSDCGRDGMIYTPIE